MARLGLFLMLVFVAMTMTLADKDYKQKFNEFKQKHGKKYKDNNDEEKRFNIFKKAVDKIDAHNKEFEGGKKTFKMGVTRAADMTDDEIKQQLMGHKENPDQDGGRAKRSVMFENTETFQWRSKRAVPGSVDWRLNGSVSPIKDQGYCGCSWSFSATGILESYQFMKTRQMVQLSEQHLIDCIGNVSPYYCDGCNGGSEYQAMKFVQNNNNNLNKESLYPYEAQKSTCRFNALNDGFTPVITSIVRTPTADETALMTAVATIGPVTAVIDASGDFQYYDSGVYRSTVCSSTNLNLAVLIIGYGIDPQYGKYWLVKPSYGTWWAESGYVRIARDSNNMCGIATQNHYPVLA